MKPSNKKINRTLAEASEVLVDGLGAGMVVAETFTI